ncbi:hypothetical protein C0992_008711 [Termitomyces sp. T32_za158]|nr:hypothetical protein C0992_008711 [Termitomyces sp. T32_za158]
MGRYGNGASVEDIARIAGISEGSVLNYTERCFMAIEALHGLFVRRMTLAEKEVEKKWMDRELGFKGLWQEGWLMYDDTIVVLYRKPGLNRDAYYTWKCNYGLNVQEHYEACRWITVAIILHNLIIDVEGSTSAVQFLHQHGREEEIEDGGFYTEPYAGDDGGDDREQKRRQLIAEIIAARGL